MLLVGLVMFLALAASCILLVPVAAGLLLPMAALPLVMIVLIL